MSEKTDSRCRCAGGWICSAHSDQAWPHCGARGAQCLNPECPWWTENPPNVDTIKTMLVVLEHTLTTLDKASAAATQLIRAQTSRTPLSPATVQRYQKEFEELTAHRKRMRELVDRWWKLVNTDPPEPGSG